MAFVLENAKRRRLVGNQRAPALWVLPLATLTALADEARSEVVAVVAVVRFPPPELLPAVACSCDRDAALAAQPIWWGHRAPAHRAARAELNATHNLSHPAVDGGAGGDGDGDGDGGAAAYRLPPRFPKRVEIYALGETDPLSASVAWGTTCGSSSSSPPSARGRIFDISW